MVCLRVSGVCPLARVKSAERINKAGGVGGAFTGQPVLGSATVHVMSVDGGGDHSIKDDEILTAAFRCCPALLLPLFLRSAWSYCDAN